MIYVQDFKMDYRLQLFHCYLFLQKQIHFGWMPTCYRNKNIIFQDIWFKIRCMNKSSWTSDDYNNNDMLFKSILKKFFFYLRLMNKQWTYIWPVLAPGYFLKIKHLYWITRVARVHLCKKKKRPFSSEGLQSAVLAGGDGLQDYKVYGLSLQWWIHLWSALVTVSGRAPKNK